MSIDYVVVDTQRVPRETFAQIWIAWRDGYTDVVAAHTEFERDEVQAHFQGMIDAIRNPDGYAVWQLPVLTALAP